MLEVKDILARLQNGESMDTIGDEIAKVMTEANKQYNEIQKKEEVEKRAKEIKANELADLLCELSDFLTKYYPEHTMTKELENELAETDPIALFDEFDKVWNGLEKMNGVIKMVLPIGKEKDTQSFSATIPVSTDGILETFLNSHGW
jgi:hypothetical protein